MGDSFVNFIYSLSKTLALSLPHGQKVKNTVLSDALDSSRLAATRPKRLDSHQKADLVEALIAYGWVKGVISIESAVKTLSTSLRDVRTFSPGEEHAKAAVAFSELMDQILTGLEALEGEVLGDKTRD